MNKLKDVKVPFLVLPTGTGNDFAKSLNMKLKFKKIINAVNNFEIQKLSSISSNKNDLIINFVCFGFAAKVNRLANKLPRILGIHKYTIATLLSLFGDISETLIFKSKNFNENGEYTLAMLVANSNNFGRNFIQLKGLEKNQIHLLLINKLSRLKFLYLFFLLQIRKHKNQKEFRIIPVDSLKVSRSFGELLPQADGESLTSGPIEFKAELDNLQFLRI